MKQVHYKEFSDASFTEFRKKLLNVKNGPLQRKLLEATLKGNLAFTRLIRDEVELTKSSEEAPLCSERLSEDEFKQAPACIEKGLYSIWRDLTRRTACRAVFWGHLTTRHIEKDLLDANFLASGTNIPGKERIARALSETDSEAPKAVDNCVRTILRRLSGLPEARGNRSVYADCPFARAWWRERLVSAIAQDDEKCAAAIRNVLRVNQTYWETLIVMVVSRNSALGSENVLHALILSLADLMELERGTPLRVAKHLKLLCRSVGVIQASHELSILNEKELRGVMDDLVLAAHVQVQGKADNAALTDE